VNEVHAAIDRIKPALQRTFRCEAKTVDEIVFRSDGKWSIANNQERKDMRC
jgi:hypothetical protein